MAKSRYEHRELRGTAPGRGRPRHLGECTEARVARAGGTGMAASVMPAVDAQSGQLETGGANRGRRLRGGAGSMGRSPEVT